MKQHSQGSYPFHLLFWSGWEVSNLRNLSVPSGALYQTELHPVIFYINNITNSQARSKNKVVLKAPMYTLTAGLLAIYNCYKAAGFTVSRTLALTYRVWNHNISNIIQQERVWSDRCLQRNRDWKCENGNRLRSVSWTPMARDCNTTFTIYLQYQSETFLEHENMLNT